MSRRRRPLRLLSTSRLQLLQNPTGSSIVREPRGGERGEKSGSKSEIYDETDNVGTHERRIYFRASSPVDKF